MAALMSMGSGVVPRLGVCSRSPMWACLSMMLVSAGSWMWASVWSVRWYWVWQSEQSLLAAGFPHASHVWLVIAGPFAGQGEGDELDGDAECFGDVLCADAVGVEALRSLGLLLGQSSPHVASWRVFSLMVMSVSR